MQKTRSNKPIECFRFIGCVFVLFIHCPFPQPLGLYVSVMGRTAVPYFLLLSGYFSYCDKPIDKAMKKLIETVKIILVAGLLCIIWNSMNSLILHHNFFIWFVQYLTSDTLKNFLLYNRAVFFNSAFYYFFIMIYVYFIYILSCKTNTVRVFYAFIPMLIFFLFYFATVGEWYWGGNWMLLGIPMFYLGNYIHSRPQIIALLSGKEIYLIFFGIISDLVEISLRFHTGYIYIGSIIIAFSLLCLCINNKDAKCPPLFEYLGTNCSLYIMIFHCEVRDTLRLFIPSNTLYFPIIVLAITITISLFVNTIIQRIRLSSESRTDSYR